MDIKQRLVVAGTGSSGNRHARLLVLDYNEPLTASIHLNYLQYPDRYHFEFLGDLGWIYYDLTRGAKGKKRQGGQGVKKKL